MSFRNFMIYMQRYFKYDLIAGSIVFLVAIPLCLGVALACGAPLYSGIISGICGGIVVGILSNSQLSVSGPSAAIAAVIINAMVYLTSFNDLLVAIFLSGIVQLFMANKRFGFIADYIPSNIIQGMLSAIGLLLIIKQVPLAFTLSKNSTDLKVLLLDSAEGLGTHPALHFSFQINSGAAILSILCLASLLYFEKAKNSWLKYIPGPILVVILGTLVNEWFIFKDSYLAQSGPRLVNLPEYNSVSHIWDTLASPNWNALENPYVYLYALLIASVTSLESLLNVNATERLDPKHQRIDTNRELFAQGIGNITASLLGGIPVSSVVVRSSVNIQSQAKSKVSTILHGFLLAFSFFFIPNILNHIPLCILASILIYTGYKLTQPKIYTNIYQQGLSRFLPFIATVIGILAFNLLFGIVLGLIINLIYILKFNSSARIDIIQENYPTGITNRLILPQQTTFLNKATIVAELNGIPNNSQLIIDARYAEFIDKEIIEYLKMYQNELAPARLISLNFIGFKDDYAIHDYINFINVTTYDAQSQLTPSEVLEILQQGNERFLNDQRIHRSNQIDIFHTSETQHPIAIVLGCIDSRVPVETVFDMTMGDLFCVRVAGNVVNDDILASIEYACNVVGAKLIVILGHTKCGAINAACEHVEKGHITQLLGKIKPAIQIEEKFSKNLALELNFVDKVTNLNVAHSMMEIYSRSSILRDMLKANEIGIVGAIYDVTTGQVNFSNYIHEIANFNKPESKELISSISGWYPEPSSSNC